MNFARFAVGRPVFTSMVACIVLILGGVSLSRLPVDLMPDITYPTVSISTTYDGSLTHLAWLRAGRTRIAAVFCPTRLASAPSPWARSGIRRPRVASWCRQIGRAHV